MLDNNTIYNIFRSLDDDDDWLLERDQRCFVFSEKVSEVYRRSFLDNDKLEVKVLNQLHYDFHDHIVGVDVLDTIGICDEQSELSNYLDRNNESFNVFLERNHEHLTNPDGRKYFVFLVSQDLQDKGGHWIACIFDMEKEKIYVNDSMQYGNSHIYEQIFMRLFGFLGMNLRVVISGKSTQCKLRPFIRQPTGGFEQVPVYDTIGRLIITFEDQHHFCYVEALLYTCEFFIKYLHKETFPPLRSYRQTLIVIKRFMSQILHKFGNIRKETIEDVFKDEFTINDVTDGFRYICTTSGPKRINSLDLSKRHLKNKSILEIVKDSYTKIYFT